MANSSRDNILANIKSGLMNRTEELPAKPDFQAAIYAADDKDPALLFAENFIARKGNFFYAQSLEEFHDQINGFVKERGFKEIHVWEKELADELQFCNFSFSTQDRNFLQVECGMTLCEALIARTGSMLMTSRQLSGRRLGIFPPVHVVVASTTQILPDVRDGLEFLKKKYGSRLPSMVSLVTGASRTADIEKTLVLGAHGPKELVLFLIDDVEA